MRWGAETPERGTPSGMVDSCVEGSDGGGGGVDLIGIGVETELLFGPESDFPMGAGP